MTKRDVFDELKKIRASRLPTGSAGSADLRTIYDTIYNSMSGTESSYSDRRALLALKLLLYGKKKLSIQAFLQAVNALLPVESLKKSTNGVIASNYRQEVERLTETCQRLIVQDEISCVLRFQHPSIAQHLREKVGYEIEAHAAMAEACLANILKVERRQRAVPMRNKRSVASSRQNGSPDNRRGRTQTRSPAPGPAGQRSSSQAPDGAASRRISRSSSGNRPRGMDEYDFAGVNPGRHGTSATP